MCTIPPLPEDDPRGDPATDSYPRLPRMSCGRRNQYLSVARKVFSRLPESADHSLLVVGDSPEMEQLASYLAIAIGDGRSVEHMKQAVRAREVVEMVGCAPTLKADRMYLMTGAILRRVRKAAHSTS